MKREIVITLQQLAVALLQLSLVELYKWVWLKSFGIYAASFVLKLYALLTAIIHSDIVCVHTSSVYNSTVFWTPYSYSIRILVSQCQHHIKNKKDCLVDYVVYVTL